MRLLITGITGFVGSHMAEYALAQGAQVFGSARWRSRMEQSHTKGIAVKIDPERLRPSDVMVLEGDPSKIRRCLGWEVEIPFEHTLRDLLAYWRQRIEWSRR